MTHLQEEAGIKAFCFQTVAQKGKHLSPVWLPEAQGVSHLCFMKKKIKYQCIPKRNEQDPFNNTKILCFPFTYSAEMRR